MVRYAAAKGEQAYQHKKRETTYVERLCKVSITLTPPTRQDKKFKWRIIIND